MQIMRVGRFLHMMRRKQSSEARCWSALFESAIVRSVFGHSDISRRSFMGLVGGGNRCSGSCVGFPDRQGEGSHPRQSGHAGEDRPQHRLRADHLRHANHHGAAAGLL
jgi:hypothetical protein